MEPKAINYLDRPREPFEKSGKYSFFVYEHNGQDGIIDTRLISQYATAYTEIYGATGEGEWAESWSPYDVEASLELDIKDPKKSHPFIISMEHLEELAGIVFGYSIATEDISDTEIPFSLLGDGDLKSSTSRQLKEILQKDFLQEDFLYIKELGIKQSERGGFDKIYILFKAIINQAQKYQKKYIVFWTSKSKKLFPLVIVIGCQEVLEVYDVDNNVYMVGDIDLLASVFQDTAQDILRKYILRK